MRGTRSVLPFLVMILATVSVAGAQTAKPPIKIGYVNAFSGPLALYAPTQRAAEIPMAKRVPARSVSVRPEGRDV